MSIGSSCGICLRLVGGSECPSTDAMEMLPNCDQLHAVGELCEGDGECGTVPTANNCNGNGDVYMRCTAAPGLRQPPWPPPSGPARPPPPRVPPRPPQPPLSPMAECAAPCDAGAECGACLQLVPAGECPAEAAAVDRLPRCLGLRPGEVCEGGGECGTAQTANNCHGYRDVYVRAACVPAAPVVGGADLLRDPLIAGVSAALLLLLIIAGVRSIEIDRETQGLAADDHSRSSHGLTPLPIPKRCPRRWPTAAGEHGTGWEGAGWVPRRGAARAPPPPPPPPPPRWSSSSTGLRTGAGRVVRPRPSSCRVRYELTIRVGRVRTGDSDCERVSLSVRKRPRLAPLCTVHTARKV